MKRISLKTSIVVVNEDDGTEFAINASNENVTVEGAIDHLLDGINLIRIHGKEEKDSN